MSLTNMEAPIVKLQEIFKTMVYGENTEDTSEAKAWLKTITILNKSSDIESIIKAVKPYKPQQTHLLRLAEEVEKNSALISQIEVHRGVLTKDTKQAVHNLAQYFYYYACYVEENEDKEAKLKTALGVFKDDHPLWVLGLFLGPALATGHSVILQVGTKFAAVVTLIVNLATKVGIPEKSLQVLPSNDFSLDPYLYGGETTIKVATLFLDVFDDNYKEIVFWEKKVLIFSGYKTAMLVFDDADLDSAVDSALEGTWGYQGMHPWALDTVLVQENIFKTFVDKLKARLESIRIGNSDDRLADISLPNNPDICLKLSKLVSEARLLGIEVYQKAEGDDFTPTLIIGSKVYTNNVVSSPDVDYALTLLPFRSIDEGVSLANNSRQGLGVSAWSENIGLLNEVAGKLKAGNVWLNCHGQFCPSVSFTPVKNSGTGYFGGKEGLIEFKQRQPDKQIIKVSGDLWKLKNVDSVKCCIDAANKASSSWSKVSTIDKLKTFLKLLDFLQADQNNFSGELPKSQVNTFVTNLRWVVKQQTGGTSLTLKALTVNVFKVPRGVLAFEMDNPLEERQVKLLLAALLTGNAVLLINLNVQAQAMYEELSKKLPSGLLSVVPYSLSAVKTCFRHKQLNGFYSTYRIYELLLDERIIYSWIPENLDWEQITNMVTTTKNVWSNVGQSSQCSL